MATLLIPHHYAVVSTLSIWAFGTLPQTALSVCFSVVMNAVPGREGRYDLLSRRWAILGLTSFTATFVFTEFLDRIVFPLNYEIMFLGLSVGWPVSISPIESACRNRFRHRWPPAKRPAKPSAIP